MQGEDRCARDRASLVRPIPTSRVVNIVTLLDSTLAGGTNKGLQRRKLLGKVDLLVLIPALQSPITNERAGLDARQG